MPSSENDCMNPVRAISLAFPEALEEPHFEKTSFRVRKKIFATLDEKTGMVCVMLSEIDQDVFSLIDKEAIYPVPNKWGKQGWTFVHPEKLRDDVLTDVLTTAYCEVAPAKLAQQVRPEKPE
jgi:predicted DNA-binding protein (MmcQ/YjbR family)